MKSIIRGYGVNMAPQQKWTVRAQAADLTRTRGTGRVPQPPQGVIVQSSSRGILVSWSLPANSTDIQRWRVFKDDESSLYSEINDRGIRQCLVQADAGSSPPVTNVFVSSVNSIGSESVKVQAQGKATAEASAPATATVPLANTGVSTSTNYLNRKQNEIVTVIQ